MTNAKKIVRKAMLNRGVTIEWMAKQLGYARGSSVASKLNNHSEMSVKAFVDLLDILHCKLVVIDEMSKSKATWEVRDLDGLEEDDTL